MNGITGIINAPNDVMYVKIEKFQMYLDDDFYKFIDNYEILYDSIDLIFIIY